MSPSDERRIELEIVVPGPPEQVWEAIATGPGISSWFVPAEVDPQQGGKATLHFGGAGDDVAVIEAWEPQRRFASASHGEDGRRVVVEYLVEARDGGSCVVRFVQSGFGSSAEWDDEYDETTKGWRTFLHNLRLYLTFFPGQTASPISVVAATPGPRAQVWETLATSLGVSSLGEGDRVTIAAADGPQLAGVVDRRAGHHATLLLDEPAPGFAVVAAGGGHGEEKAYVHMAAYLFGPDAAAVAEREQPRWQAWVERQFPPLPEGGG